MYVVAVQYLYNYVHVNTPVTTMQVYTCSDYLFFLGKTLLAKAVANQTSATFLRVCGSELIQKYLVRYTYR